MIDECRMHRFVEENLHKNHYWQDIDDDEMEPMQESVLVKWM